MKKVTILAAAIYGAATVATLPSVALAKTVLAVGADISTSAAFTDPDTSELPNRAATMVYREAKQLEVGDTIIVRTIGEYGSAATEEIVINVTRKNPPERAARIAATLVAQVPKKITEGEWERANSTNILWFMKDVAEQYDCIRNTVILLTFADGLEHSEYITEKQMLGGTGKLPTFDPPVLVGCRIGMHGIGERANNTSLAVADQLVSTWTQFLENNQVSDFSVTKYIPQ